LLKLGLQNQGIIPPFFNMPKKMWLRQDAKYFTGQQNSSKLLKAEKIPICTHPCPEMVQLYNRTR